MSANHRDQGGRFTKGCPAGPGCKGNRRVARWRQALDSAVTDRDIVAVCKRLIKAAKGGDVQAIRELFNRTLGTPGQADLLERLEEIEDKLREVQNHAVR